MANFPSDEEVARQILGIFLKHRVPVGGTLRRNYFFKVRDSDFQQGLNKAIEKKWLRLHKHDRYTYELTDAGASEISEFPRLPRPP